MMDNLLRIAYLEDDLEQAKMVIGWFEEFGYDYEHFTRAQALLSRLKDQSFDIAVLDWELPEMSGLDALKQIRSKFHQNLPILFCSMRDSETDVVQALELGADDYMRKPLLRVELKARLQALLRRTKGAQTDVMIEHGPYRFDLKNKIALVNGVSVDMTDKDFEVASCLFDNIGRILSRSFLLESVWGISSDLNTRTVDVHVSRVRKALGITPESGFRVKTIYQHGYRLEKVESI
ncbi:MAG: response regulator transcription factor [Oleispira sp.]|nr:response regulator transcription factor [Oleispira sp.]MBL4882418.1 response regulator transcription factor [Oleispira sp.]